MDLKVLLVCIVIVVFLALLWIFPEFRSLLSGAFRVFVKDMATTPEGAEAIYQEKINEAQDRYNAADKVYRTTSGKLEIEKNKLKKLESKLKEVESQCESLVRQNSLEAAEIKAEERAELISDIERSKQLIEAYSSAAKDAQEVYKACEQNLTKLKKEKKEVVENMRVKIQMNQAYDEIDDLKATTGTDKLLASIKEKNEDLNASVAGAKVIHENRTSTKVQRANEQAKKIQSNDYLEQLKKKYNK